MGIWIPLLAVGFVFILYKFVYVALQRMNFYKKQGLRTEFSPLVGTFIMNVQTSTKKYNDGIYDLKLLAEKEPNLRALVRNFGATPVVLLMDPALKKEFAFNHQHYEVANMFGEFAKIFSAGLTGAQGNVWKKQRKIVGQSFHFEFIRENVPAIVQTTRRLIQDISKRDMKAVKVIAEMEKIAGENVGTIFFSENVTKYTIKGEAISSFLVTILTRLGKALMSPGYLMFGAKYIEKGIWGSHRELIDDFKQVNTVLSKILDDRKNSNTTRKDIAHFLLEAQKSPNEEDRLTDFEIIGNYATFIAAGTGTTSATLGMVLYSLTQNPEILAKLREEITEIYDKEDLITVDSLNRMDYLTAIIKEALRLYNPIGIGPGFKEASEDHKLGDITIKKGTRVVASLVHTNFQSRYFEDPTSFKPERWLKKETLLTDPYAFTPFWAGPRNCIGQHLAMIEAKIMVCEFVKMYDFELIPNYQLKLGIEKGYGAMGDLPMNLTLRDLR